MGVPFPAAFANAPIAGPGFGELHLTGAIINLPAIMLIAGLSIVLVIGVRESSAFNGVMVLIKTGIVLLVILFGLPYVSGSNLQPFIPPNKGEWGHFGISGSPPAPGLTHFAHLR